MSINKDDCIDPDLAQNLALSQEEIDFLTKKPIKFIEGNFADYMWGGYHLYDMKGLPYDENTRIAAESWEVSGHRKYPSRLMMPNGNIFTLMDLLRNKHLANLILGESVVKHFGQNFPILVKFVLLNHSKAITRLPSNVGCTPSSE
jgi:mannose-6-phosphate isomerase class I